MKIKIIYKKLGREQEKRQTPTVINAGITNNNTNVRNTSRAEAKAA